MPIEIRELHIKAVIEDSKTASNNGGSTNTSASGSKALPKVDDLVSICVEKVLEIIKQKKER